MQIIHDLSRHAAEKAAESIFTVAMTSPRLDMINVVSLTAALLLGQAAKDTTRLKQEDLAMMMLRGELPDVVEQAVRDFESQRG